MRTGRLLALGVSLSAMAGNAFGDTVSGSYTASNTLDIGVTAVGWVLGPSNNLHTLTYNWTRNDLPPVAGVDTTLPQNFQSYCIDINQSVAGNLSHTYEVISGQTAGLSATQILLLSRLWGGFQSQVTNTTTSAAFQAAVYEIQFDGNSSINITSGNFLVQSVSGAVRTTAAQWLSVVTNLATPLPTPEIAILVNASVQDQITVRIPSPGATALAGVAAGAIALRRPRRRS